MRAHCYRIRRRLAAGETPRQMPERLRRHMEACERCRTEAQAYESLRSALRSGSECAGTSVRWEDVRSRLSAQPDAVAEVRRRMRLSPVWTACAAAALLAAFWLFRPPGLDPGGVREATGPPSHPAATAPDRTPEPLAVPAPKPSVREPKVAWAADSTRQPAPRRRRAADRYRTARRAPQHEKTDRLAAAPKPKPEEPPAPELIVTSSIEHVLPAAHSAEYSPDVDYVMEEVTPVARPVAVRL